MTIPEFIDQAIEGGWKAPERFDLLNPAERQFLLKEGIHEWVLDPTFWQAVGKVEGWDEETTSYKVAKREVETYRGSFVRPAHTITRKKYRNGNVWKIKMHAMIDALAEGKSLEEALAKIK